MRNLAVFGAAPGPAASFSPLLQQVTIDDVALRCGIVRTKPPAFDAAAPENHDRALVRVRAFSCNYRDKGFCYRMHLQPQHRFFAVGSEFSGEVVAVGSGVVALRPGDRVVANHHYEGGTGLPSGLREGVLSNQSSKEYQLFPTEKLIAIPESMSDEIAAAFSLNAQTAYAMVRRLAPRPGANVLVTSARSNTSLFIIAALRKHAVNIYAATTSVHTAPRLKELGVTHVVALERGGGFFQDSDVIDTIADTIGGFDCVFDPMFDAHLEKAVRVMAPFGSYVTCGLIGQNPNSQRTSGLHAPADVNRIMTSCILRNLTIMGNCVGLADDLRAAVHDHQAGTFTPVIDSVYTGDHAGAFLNRTFNDPDRFGKVVFRYN